MIHQDHIFFDLETSSLKPEDGCVIEIAAIRTDSKGNILASFCDRVIPDREVKPSVAKINGYNKETWGGVPFHSAIASFNRSIVRPFSDKAVFVGHFCDFDRNFLSSDCIRFGLEIPLQSRAWICTGNLVWPFLFNDQLSSRKLVDIARFMNIPTEGAHTASGDAKMCCDVYWELMRRYSTMLIAHTAISQSGGRKVFSFMEKIVNGF